MSNYFVGGWLAVSSFERDSVVLLVSSVDSGSASLVPVLTADVSGLVLVDQK